MTTVVVALIPGVVSVVIAVLAYRQATVANRASIALETRKVDQIAFESAQRIYEGSIASLERQLADARARIAELERRIIG